MKLALACAFALGAAPAFAQTAPLDWSGFYLGGSIESRQGTATSLQTQTLEGLHGFDLDRARGAAVHAGYNAVLGTVLVGVELGYSGGRLRGAGSAPPAPAATHTVENLATLRARFGLPMGRALPYLALGVARADASRHSAYQDQTVAASHRGMVVAVGMDYALTGNLSMRAEYERLDLGPQLYAFPQGNQPTVDLRADTVRLGLNWHF